MGKKPPSKKPLPPARRRALEQLTTLLGREPALLREVQLAIDDPAAYLRCFRQRAEDHGIDEPDADLPWAALIMGLDARKRLASIDWKFAAEDVMWNLDRLKTRPRGKRWGFPAEPPVDEMATAEFLEYAGRHLAGKGLALASLNNSSDSYPLVLLPAGEVATARKLARTAGFGSLDVFTGAGYEEQRRDRLRQEKRDAPPPPTDRWKVLLAGQDRWSRNVDGVLWSLRHFPFPIDAVRAVLPAAPAKARPLIALTVALHDGDALALARTTREPALCLHALRYLGREHERGRARARLEGAAILADRLKLGTAKITPSHLDVLAACNLFDQDGAAGDAAWKALPAAAKARLARLADAVYLGRGGETRKDDARRALARVGDAASLALLRAREEPILPGATSLTNGQRAMVCIERRLGTARKRT